MGAHRRPWSNARLGSLAVKAAITVGVLALALAWVWWARRRYQQRHLSWLVRRSGTSTARARLVTVGTEVVALVLALAALAVAVVSEQEWAAYFLRLPLALLVLVGYVPYAAMLAPVRTARRVRRTPEERLIESGAPGDVARAVAAVGAPFAAVGTLVMLAAVYVLVWHHIAR